MQLIYHQVILDLLVQHRIDLKRLIEEKYKKGPSLSTNPETRHSQISEYQRWLLYWKKLNRSLSAPAISEANVRQLNALERRYSVILPAAVREWYSLNFALDLTALRWSDPDSKAFPISKIQPFTARERDISERHDLWAFMTYEFVGANIQDIAFKIDAGDDPPVFAEIGQNDAIQVAPTFSEYIRLFFWDWLSYYRFGYGFRVGGFAAPSPYELPPAQRVPMSTLQQRYRQIDGLFKSRFYDDSTCITIFHRSQSGLFRTQTAEQLMELIHLLWGNNPPIFQMQSYNHKSSIAVIQDLRDTLILKAMARVDGWISVNELRRDFNYDVITLRNHLNRLADHGLVEAYKDNHVISAHDQRYRFIREK